MVVKTSNLTPQEHARIVTNLLPEHGFKPLTPYQEYLSDRKRNRLLEMWDSNWLHEKNQPSLGMLKGTR
jgi:hypothetical protein